VWAWWLKIDPGVEIEIKAKAVIVATGGFGDNPKMIKKYTGYEWGKDLHTFASPDWRATECA